MFTQSDEKVETNPLRQLLLERGHTVRSAARSLKMHPTTFSYQLSAHDAPNEFVSRVRSLPRRARGGKQQEKLSTAAGEPGAATEPTTKTKKATA